MHPVDLEETPRGGDHLRNVVALLVYVHLRNVERTHINLSES